MEVFRSLDAYVPGDQTVATIGTFDGLHVGHQAIFSRMQEVAQEAGGETTLISFHPHPRLVLFPENNPLRLLQSLEEKIDQLTTLGLDKLLLIPFTREFSRMSSKNFVLDILVKTVHVRHVIIGYDHHFGKNRTGSIEELRKLSQKYKYQVEQIAPLSIGSSNVSSTKIRRALEDGDILTANRYLGYPYALRGKVVSGEKQGREFGYPTANIEPDEAWKLIPREGVYLTSVKVEGYPSGLYGMLSIGKKPTLGEFTPVYEVHIFDFADDIYTKEIQVEFIDFLRPQVKFQGIPDLINAMKGDEERCRRILKERGVS
ncbi:MAG: bifunctional riboflavin kinase/FAD synthetase [Bacteroidota bacterium]